MTFITGNADEGIYLSRYNYANDWALNSELLFQFLNVFCNKIGLSFVQYKGVLAFLYICLVGSSIWNLSKYPNLILIFFFLCPFPLNVSQLRFALASSVFIFSYKYLLSDDSKEIKKHFFSKNEIRFILCTIIATLIHTVAIFWLLLLVVKRLSIKQAVIFNAIFSLFIYFIFNPSSVNWLLEKIGAASRMNAYFSTAYQNSDYRHYGGALIQVVFICAICLFCLFLIKKNKSKWSIQTEYVLKYDIFSLSLCAFILRYTSEMYRPLEGLMLLNYIVLSNQCADFNLLKLKGKKSDVLVKLLLVILVVGAFYLKVCLYNKSVVWDPMFF